MQFKYLTKLNDKKRTCLNLKSAVVCFALSMFVLGCNADKAVPNSSNQFTQVDVSALYATPKTSIDL